MPFVTVYDFDTAVTFAEGGYGPVNELDNIDVVLYTSANLELEMNQEISINVSTNKEIQMVVRL